jgi:hypothetical protein
MTPEQLQAYRWEREIDERNRPLSDDELDAMFPPGYKVLTPPAGKMSLLTDFYKWLTSHNPHSLEVIVNVLQLDQRTQTTDGYYCAHLTADCLCVQIVCGLPSCGNCLVV